MTMIISGSDGLEFPDGSDQGTAFTGNAATITSGTLDAARLPSSGVNAASITVGTVATARLATGTANSSTYLRGDQTWAAVPTATPGGSTTQVQYNNAGAFGGDSGFVYSSGNVGIGTSSPTANTLTLTGKYALFSDSQTALGDDGLISSGTADGNTQLRYFTGKYLRFMSSTTEVMRIDSSGNLGVGTTSPSARLDSTRSFTSSGLAAVVSSPNLALTNTANFGYPVGMLFRAPLASGGSVINNASIWAEWSGTNNAYLGFATTNSGTLAERMRIDSSGNLLFNSGYGSVATAYGVRAWVNFNGTGTPSIRASGNVSSITDNGTGNFTVNFSTAMPDANYSVAGMASDTGGVGNRGLVALYRGVAAPSTSSFTIFTFTDSTQTDNTYVYVSVFR